MSDQLTVIPYDGPTPPSARTMAAIRNAALEEAAQALEPWTDPIISNEFEQAQEIIRALKTIAPGDDQ
jgi:hypothetical protein